MPETAEIKPGTRFTLKLKSKEESDPDFALSTTLEAQTDDMGMLIYAPMHKSHLYPVNVGETLDITFFELNLKHTFKAIVRGRMAKDNFNFLQIERITDIARTQRRDDFRLDHSVPVKIQYKVIKLGKPKRVTIQGYTVDVSGGGLSFRLSQRLYEGDIVDVEFELYDSVISMSCKIMWFVELKENPMYRYFCGCRFQHRTPAEKERLVRTIFKLQQEQIKLMDR